MTKKPSKAVRIGLALSGGGARGLSHIPVLEALDEVGIRPVGIAGTSIGAVIGAGYSAGMSGRDIRDYAIDVFRQPANVFQRLWPLRPKRVRDLFGEGGLSRGQFDAQALLRTFLPDAVPEGFADLTIPLTVITTDFYACREVPISAGLLFPALAASVALPLAFRPVTLGGNVMVDGGITNPLPIDRVPGKPTFVLAVDVVGRPTRTHNTIPGPAETIIGSLQLLMHSVVEQKLRRPKPPCALIRVPVGSYRMFDFMKARHIITSAQPVKEEVKRILEGSIG